jgi:RimJ/RimL family protein N-acetyltransferase
MDAFDIITRRLKLTPVTDGQQEELRTKIFAHPDVVKTLMGDASNPEKQKYLVDAWYEEYAGTWQRQGYGLWGVYKKSASSDDLPSGLLGIIWLEDTSTKDVKTVDIGYALTPNAWGKGIISEAAEAVMSYAFRKIGAEAIDALIFGAINPGSSRVIEKLGGRYLGQKPFLEYGDQEWFEATHSFDLWLIETARPEMIETRVIGACFRTGQFAGERLLSRTDAINGILRAIEKNEAMAPSNDLMKTLEDAVDRGRRAPGWSHYRIENTERQRTL